MTIEANKEIARRLLDALAAGDLVEMDALMAPGSTYRIMGDTPISAAHEKQDFINMAAGMRDSFASPFTFTYGDITAEGNRVCVEARSYLELKSGKTYQNEYHILFHIDNGKIASVKEYNDTKHVMDTFF